MTQVRFVATGAGASQRVTVDGVGVIPWASQGGRHIFRIGRLLAANAKWPNKEPDPKA